MAEFLIYNKTHWYDLPSEDTPGLTGYEQNHFAIDIDNKLNVAQKIKAKDILTLKYAVRYQKGDIVEVRPDGYWTGGKRKGFGSHAFALVAVPSISMENARKYMDSQVDLADPENPVLLKRRKYQMDMAQISLSSEKSAEFADISDAHITDKSKVAAQL